MMNNTKYRFAWSLGLTLMLLAGCGLISGTFVLVVKLVENEDLLWQGDYYYHEVDLTTDEVWKDHADEIEYIDLVGFEVWGTFAPPLDSYDVYIARPESPLTSLSAPATVQADAIKVLEGVTAVGVENTFQNPRSDRMISYGQSFDFLRNVDSLKAMALDGEFKLWAIPASGDTLDMHIDTLSVIVTFTAQQ